MSDRFISCLLYLHPYSPCSSIFSSGFLEVIHWWSCLVLDKTGVTCLHTKDEKGLGYCTSSSLGIKEVSLSNLHQVTLYWRDNTATEELVEVRAYGLLQIAKSQEKIMNCSDEGGLFTGQETDLSFCVFFLFWGSGGVTGDQNQVLCTL